MPSVKQNVGRRKRHLKRRAGTRLDANVMSHLLDHNVYRLLPSFLPIKILAFDELLQRFSIVSDRPKMFARDKCW